MAWTLQNLQTLETAIASGTYQVSYDGKMVTYQSLSQMVAARQIIRDELIGNGQLAAQPNNNRGPASLAVFGRD